MATAAESPVAKAPPTATLHNVPTHQSAAAETERPPEVTMAQSRRSSASSAPSGSRRPSLTRRTSLEEDYFYREVMTVEKRPTEPPPSYESTMKKIRRKERQEAAAAASAAAAAAAATPAPAPAPAPAPKALPPSYKGKGKAPVSAVQPTHVSATGAVHASVPDDVLPAYSCDIHMEGVFQRKMEIENATKRAQDRRWTQSYVVLHGTSLEVYECRKDRSWAGRTARTGPGVSPDRPPWMRRGSLERHYNLSYADAGIAADYVKRRYVIRVRAETDQFLLSCVELETFIQWLDALFAALSVAAPIDERDFPRDQSIPRLQRIRWYHGRDREREQERDRESDRESNRESDQESNRESNHENDHENRTESDRASTRQPDDAGNTSADDDEAADVVSPLPSPSLSRPISPMGTPSKSVRTGQSLAAAAAAVLAEESGRQAPAVAAAPAAGAGSVSSNASSNASSTSLATTSSASTAAGPVTPPLHNVSAQQRAAAIAMLSTGVPASDSNANGNAGSSTGGRFSLWSIRSRLSLRGQASSSGSANGPGRQLNVPTIYQHAAVNAATGKWQPSHRWTKTHDMVYAKLCYATLLFRSPRKSNYIVVRGKQWLVDWSTGNMARVSPPRYGEIETQPGPFHVMRTENIRI